MPKAASTDYPSDSGPSALEMFTDRVSEQELLTRLLAPHQQGEIVNPKDFLTTFYGVGGVGKTTLCKQVTTTCRVVYPEVAIARLNLDSNKWDPPTSFAELLVALLSELGGQKISCPLTQALLLMYHQASTAVGQTGAATGLWAAAVSTLDQATQAAGVPGIGLVIQGAQWLREHRQQLNTRRRLEDLKLWPKDDGDQIDRLDLEDKLVKALYEDLKLWSLEKKDLRILFDGFERIQGRERKRDCQMLLQKFAGCIAKSVVPELYAQIRIFIFTRDILRWDELYDDDDWKNYWTQHLLEGLGEDDAKEFLRKYADWLQSHEYPTHADLINKSIDAILDAADEHVGTSRLIYPYYLDLAITIIRQAADSNRKPDLGKTPGELQDRFFRYLPPQELHLLKILALAEKFDADLFDALVREHRVAGFAIGTFTTTVVDGRSYVSESGEGFYRFHRLMAKALLDQWLKTDEVRQQGGEAVRWIFVYFTAKLVDIPRKDWGDAELEKWRHGMAVIIPQHDCRRRLISFEELEKILWSEHWRITYPVSLREQMEIAEERFRLVTESPACPTDYRLHSGIDFTKLLLSANKQSEATGLARDLLSSARQLLGDEEPQTLKCIELLVEYLMQANTSASVDDYKAREAELILLQRTSIRLNEKINGIEHPETLRAMAKITSLPFQLMLPREDSNLLGSEFFKRAEALFEREAVNNQDHNAGITAILIFGLVSRICVNREVPEAFQVHDKERV